MSATGRPAIADNYCRRRELPPTHVVLTKFLSPRKHCATTTARARKVICSLYSDIVVARACHGLQAVISKFGLREGKDEQTYGLGLKEVWRVPKEKCKPG